MGNQATGPCIKSFTALTIFHNFSVFRKTCSRLVGSRQAPEFVCTRASLCHVYCNQTRMYMPVVVTLLHWPSLPSHLVTFWSPRYYALSLLCSILCTLATFSLVYCSPPIIRSSPLFPAPLAPYRASVVFGLSSRSLVESAIRCSETCRSLARDRRTVILNACTLNFKIIYIAYKFSTVGSLRPTNIRNGPAGRMRRAEV